MKHSIRGKRWNVVFRKLSKEWGLCAPKLREITLDSGADSGALLYAVLHEGLHAAFPDLDEASVTEASSDISALMTRLGFVHRDEL